MFTEEKKQRNINLVAEGRHTQPFIEIGNTQLPVSRTTSTTDALKYFVYDFMRDGGIAEPTTSTCPCTSSLI